MFLYPPMHCSITCVIDVYGHVTAVLGSLCVYLRCVYILFITMVWRIPDTFTLKNNDVLEQILMKAIELSIGEYVVSFVVCVCNVCCVFLCVVACFRVQNNSRPSAIFQPKHRITDQTCNHSAICASQFLNRSCFDTL